MLEVQGAEFDQVREAREESSITSNDDNATLLGDGEVSGDLSISSSCKDALTSKC